MLLLHIYIYLDYYQGPAKAGRVSFVHKYLKLEYIASFIFTALFVLKWINTKIKTYLNSF